MSDLIKTTVLKPHLGPDGVITKVGQTIEVEPSRYKALEKKGYVAGNGGAAEEAAPKAVKEAITNADFAGKSTPISGSGSTAPNETKSLPKGAASTKRKGKVA